MLYLIMLYLPSIIAGIHAVRTGRAQLWLFVLVIAPGLGPIIYFFAEIVPEMLGGRTARKLGSAARHALDPERAYREAKRALDDTPTVGNQMKLAQAAAAVGRWQEAEAAWTQAGQGHFADDPAILLGHANALLELNRFDDALKKLDALRALGKVGETPSVALAYGRACEGLGRANDADEAYRFAADRVPGLEAGARYVAFLAKTGRKADAETGFGEIERRFAKISPALRAEARPWRDMAARAIGRA